MLGSEGLRASIFGAVGLAIDGDPIELRGRQRRRMVATLLADVGRPVPALRLLDVLDVRPTSSAATDPANAVQAQVRRLRDLIEPGVPARSASRLLSTAEGYVLQPAAYDLWDYSAAVRAARDLIETAPRSSVEQYCTARAMWFSPWGDLGDDPLVSGLVSHLEEQHRIVEEEWGGLILDLGQGSLYADELLAMARREPSRERRWGAAIRALFQASRQADALRTYDEARSTLRQEFGVDPGADLIEIERAVLRQDHAALGARRSEQTVATSSRSAPLTSFVGRRDELTLLDEATARHRVVTVIGLGGVGKSRLVAEWSTRSPAGTSAHSIDLRGVERGQDIGRRFADDMDLGTAGEDQIDPIDLVVATLTHTRSLLLIDNAEHLAEDLARVVLRLTDVIPDLRVVITSRVPMALTGEFTVRIDPLRVPDDREPVAGTAAELVLDRLGPDGDEATARAIARRYGGLPLPLELVAAAHDAVAVDGPAAEGLETVAADASIASAVDVALGQISPAAEHLLWRCLQFPDGASSTLLGVVAPTMDEGGRNSTARLLRELVGASLLATSASATGIRYRGLQPLSELADRRLDPLDRRRTIRDAASWWGTLGRDSYFDPPDVGGLRALEADHRNISSALDHLMEYDPLSGLRLVVETTDHWSISGRWAQARRWIDLGLARVDPDDRLRTALRVTYWYCSSGIASIAAEQNLIREAIDQIGGPSLAAPDLWAVLHLQLGVSQAWNGDLPAASQSIEVARRVAGDHRSDWFLATIDRFSALGHLITGDPLEGVAIAIDAADRLESVGDPSAAAGSLYHASVLGRAGRLEDQTDVLLRARLLAGAGRSPGIRALVAVEAAHNARRLGHEDAADQLDRAATLTDAAGNLRTGGIARRDLGLMLLDMGRREAASAQLVRSIRPLLLLDRRAAALALAGLIQAAVRPAAPGDEFRHAAWSLAADRSGTPLTEADRAALERMVGARPDPLCAPASIDDLVDDLLAASVRGTGPDPLRSPGR